MSKSSSSLWELAYVYLQRNICEIFISKNMMNKSHMGTRSEGPLWSQQAWLEVNARTIRKARITHSSGSEKKQQARMMKAVAVHLFGPTGFKNSRQVKKLHCAFVHSSMHSRRPIVAFYGRSAFGKPPDTKWEFSQLRKERKFLEHSVTWASFK